VFDEPISKCMETIENDTGQLTSFGTESQGLTITSALIWAQDLIEQRLAETNRHKGTCNVGYSILLVEDARDTREALKLLLESQGYSVIEANNGVEAVEIASRICPDAILMDMSLPVIDGCQATRCIRGHPKLRGVPIIAFTALNRWEWRGKAILAGCTEFLTKPLEFGRVTTMLARYLPGENREN
jgi:two-component system cell cycle response regulator DivK